MRILIVDDHPTRCETLRRVLEQNFFIVDWHEKSADRAFTAHLKTYDLLIIDADAAPFGAAKLCREIRANRHETPVLLLGAAESSEEVAFCLNSGADDYVDRSLPLVEKIARIRALLRRPQVLRKDSVRVDDLHVDLTARLVYRAKKEIHLTRMEYLLLEFLAERQGQLVPKSEIIEHLWGDEAEISQNAVETHVHTLRRKIDRARKLPLLRNIPGRGYRFG
jgi:two-component system OmpR family response regulator